MWKNSHDSVFKMWVYVLVYSGACFICMKNASIFSEIPFKLLYNLEGNKNNIKIPMCHLFEFTIPVDFEFMYSFYIFQVEFST